MATLMQETVVVPPQFSTWEGGLYSFLYYYCCCCCWILQFQM